MTNKEFYSEKLLAIALGDFCHELHVAFYDESCIERKKCEDCEFSGNERILQWLNAEHIKPEPPLLKNGDGLKPGDWIMVRDIDSQSFVRRQFLYFFDGKFICSSPNHAPLEGFGEPWVQARLLEEGE